MPATPIQTVAFGSGQERKVFPAHYAPNRLGNQMFRQDSPHLGPGAYDQEFGTLASEMARRPQSNKGYACARTAKRFQPSHKTATPSPQKYQPDQSQSTLPPPGITPFGSTAQRFRKRSSSADDSPSPAAFNPASAANRKVSWPMCFGRPDWSKLPQPEQRSIRVKLNSEKELLKQRNRVAYLSLYY